MMPTQKEIQIANFNVILKKIEQAKSEGRREDTIWQWGRAVGFANCLRSCGLLDIKESQHLQHLAIVAKQPSGEEQSPLYLSVTQLNSLITALDAVSASEADANAEVFTLLDKARETRRNALDSTCSDTLRFED